MLSSIRLKLIVSLVIVALFVGLISLFSGVRLLREYVIDEAVNRARLDLKAASEMYASHVKYIRISLTITTLGKGFISAVTHQHTNDIIYRLNRMAREAGLDFAGIVDSHGRPMGKIGPDAAITSSLRPENICVEQALVQQTPVAGTIVLSEKELDMENPEFQI